MSRRFLLALTLVVSTAVLTPAAPAIVPPKDCGFLTVKGKRYNVKSDKVPCSDARRYAKNYLTSSKRKPQGFSCKRHDPKETKLVFTCTKGTKYFNAIRR